MKGESCAKKFYPATAFNQGCYGEIHVKFQLAFEHRMSQVALRILGTSNAQPRGEPWFSRRLRFLSFIYQFNAG